MPIRIQKGPKRTSSEEGLDLNKKVIIINKEAKKHPIIAQYVFSKCFWKNIFMSFAVVKIPTIIPKRIGRRKWIVEVIFVKEVKDPTNARKKL